MLRGRALAALNHLLGVRVQKLKLEKTKGQSSASVNGQTNVQSDVQMLLAPITQSEESLLSSVRFTFTFIWFIFCEICSRKKHTYIADLFVVHAINFLCICYKMF